MNVQRMSQGFVFRSAKCREPIPIITSLMRSRLIQLSLDRGVEAIDRVDVTVGSPVRIGVRLVVAYRAGKGFVQLIETGGQDDHPSPLRRAAVEQGFEIESVDPREVVAEPRHGAAEAVWALRDHRVAPHMRVALLAALADEGPMRLDELCRQVAGPTNPVAAIASLACAGDLHLDLSDGLGPMTIVRT